MLETKPLSAKQLLLICGLMLASYQIGFSALCTSTGNGNWNSGATWSCGRVPTCNDSVVVASNHTVTVSSNENYGCSGKIAIAIYGSLTFANGRKLTLSCDSRIYLFTGSQIFVNGGGGSNTIEICGTTFWSSTSGNLSGPSCLPPTLPGCAVVLPVALFSFSGYTCAREICLQWSTATEKNNNFFLLEKTEDGTNYKSLAKIPSLSLTGNSTETLHYFTKDLAPNNGLNYYRLRQVDFDESASLSPLIVVNYIDPLGNSFTLAPNPTNEKIALTCTSPQAKIIVQVINQLGQVIIQQQAFNTKQIELSIQEKGSFLLIAEINGVAQQRKIVVL